MKLFGTEEVIERPPYFKQAHINKTNVCLTLYVLPLMKLITLTTLVLLSACKAFSQLQELQPASVIPLDFSEAAQAKWTKRDNLIKQIDAGTKSWDRLSQSEKQLLTECPDIYENIWDVLGGGDSWYNLGGPRKVKASSTLANQGAVNYKAENAHDHDYKNVWVEGVPGYGIGEYLEYSFPQYGPRITSIKIVNGYVKSTSAYQNNSRVKKLKMYVKGKPYAILNLRDEIATQTFEVEPIGTTYPENFDGEDGILWPIRFEILDVYKGIKYDDVVISEIYFDGIDVLCLAEGTPVLMANGSTTTIESIQKGDSILIWNETSHLMEQSIVEEVACALHNNLVKYIMASGKEITATADHPFLMEDGAWGSSDPEKSKNYKGFQSVEPIIIGSRFKTQDGFETLKSIELDSKAQKTYTITKLSKGRNFLANSFITGTEEVVAD